MDRNSNDIDGTGKNQAPQSSSGNDDSYIERESEETLNFERLLADLSSGFVNLPSGEIDGKIEYWLERMCDFLGADRAGLHQFLDENNEELIVTHLYTSPGVNAPVLGGYWARIDTWYRKMILSGQSVILEHLPDDIPEDHIRARRFVISEGIKSHIGLPLKAGGRVLGSVGFGALKHRRSWHESLLQRIQLVGEVFANVLLRKRIHDALRESREKFKSAFDHAAVSMAIISPRGRFLEVNGVFCRFLGYVERELLQRNLYEITHPDDLAVLKKRISKALSGEMRSFKLEIKFVRRNETTVWGFVSSSLQRDAEGEPLYFASHIQDISEVKKKTKMLEETNTALRGLLEHRGDDKRTRDKEIYTSFEKFAFPYLDKLATTPMDSEQKTYLQILRSNLEEIVQPYANKLISLESKLTHTELRVADLVKLGKSSQEIADALNMSLQAVFFHRNNIRKKLGLRKSGTNLRAFLCSLE